MKQLILTFLVSVISFHNSYCQDDIASINANSPVAIVLNSGHLIEGTIVEKIDNKEIKLKLEGVSDILTISQSEIKKIYPKSNYDASDLNYQINKGMKPKASYNFNEKGIYYSARAQIIIPNEGDRANGVFGYGVSLSAGHKLNRWLALGGGIGYDQYIWNSGEELIPLFAEVSGYFSPSNISLFYNLQTGYSIALSDDQYNITDASGGLMIYPSLGIRFGKEIHKFGIDIGYKFQRANYTYRDLWVSTTFHEQSLHYKRMSIRFSIIL